MKELLIKLATHPNVIASAIGALLGGLLAACVAIYTINKQNKLAKIREAEKRHQEKISFLKSIKAEVKALQERYMEVLGNSVESYGVLPENSSVDEWMKKRTESIIKFFPGGLIKNYHSIFVYYDNNIQQLNLLDDNQDLKSQIIKLYIYMKALFDMWVSYHDEYQELCGNASSPAFGRVTPESLADYFERIKATHFTTKEFLNNTLIDIDTFLNKENRRH